MGFYDGAKIVTNGLVLTLDAADRNSYPGTGTAWRDLINRRAFSLANGATFNNDNGGYILLDGNNQSISADTNETLDVTSGFTFEIWLYPIGVQPQYERIFEPGVSSNDSTTWRLYFGGAGSDMGMDVHNTVTTTTGDCPRTYSANAWNHFVVTANGTNWVFYRNVRNVTTLANTVLPQNNISRPFRIGTNTIGFECPNMRVAISRYYNRALSLSEVTQNYNAQKSRFGL